MSSATSGYRSADPSSPPMVAPVRLHQVSKTYPDPRTGRKRTIFTDFSLRIEPGELVAVVGASGTGKTTLLHLVAGLVPAESGAVELADRRGGHDPRLGVVFQQPRLMDWLSVTENIELAMTSAGLDPGGAAEMLAAVGLAEYAGSYPSTLSGGQRQRVAVARAFAIDPELLLLDEPFSALDELTARRLRLLLQRLWMAQRRSGFLVTHNPFEAVLLADRVIVLTGQPARITAEYRVPAPRPRSAEDPELFTLHNRIVADLT